MERFKFGIEIPQCAPAAMGRDTYRIDGRVEHFAESNQVVGMPAGEERLNLGYRIFNFAQESSPVFESRACVGDAKMPPNIWTPFYLQLPEFLLPQLEYVVLVDFLIEDKYWFHEVGGAAFLHSFVIDPGKAADMHPTSESGVRVVSNSDHIIDPLSKSAHASNADFLTLESQIASDTIRKGSQHLLSLLSSSIQAIIERYGARVAVDFAYLYILGRRADIPALISRSREIEDRSLNAHLLCKGLLESQEYKARNIIFHRNPNIVIKSWAEIADE